MSSGKKIFIAPIMLIGIGVGWLLNALEIFAVVDWIWTISLCLAGVLTLIYGGKNKLTFLIGPFLLVASAFSVLRQLELIKLACEVPCLVIVFGALWLVVEMLHLPPPEWMKSDEGAKGI